MILYDYIWNMSILATLESFETLAKLGVFRKTKILENGAANL